MKPTILFCLFVVSFSYQANAQFTLHPQVGVESSKTSIEFNEHSSFSPLSTKLSPQAAVRLDYKFKQGHGPFIGVATTRSVVNFKFSNPENAMNAYSATRGNTQLRLEGGYQASTNPIYFKKSGMGKSAKNKTQNYAVKKSCGSSAIRYSCGSKAAKTTAAKPAEKGSWVKIQPSLGVAYLPSAPPPEIYTESQGAQTTYQYNAGNWRTALISGIGFEFGKNAQSKFMVNINYFKGISNLGKRSLVVESGNKSTTTNLESDGSGWNVRMGIPISLAKKKPVAAQKIIEKKYYKEYYYKEEKKCGEYKSQYRSKCGRII